MGGGGLQPLLSFCKRLATPTQEITSSSKNATAAAATRNTSAYGYHLAGEEQGPRPRNTHSTSKASRRTEATTDLLRKAKWPGADLERISLRSALREPQTEQQREQEQHRFVTQSRWRFNKRISDNWTLSVRWVGARAIPRSFCSGKTLPGIKSETGEKIQCW